MSSFDAQFERVRIAGPPDVPSTRKKRAIKWNDSAKTLIFAGLPHPTGCMANNIRTRRKEVSVPTPFEQARDEMFQQVIRCGVPQSTPEHQEEWFTETMAYLGDRYHELTKEELSELRTLGLRFSQPPKSRIESEPVEAATAA